VVAGGANRVVAAVTTEVVAEAARRHGTAPAATIALGQAATCGLLLATLSKDEERVGVRLLGDGPLGTLVVDASGAGEVRGYVSRPRADGGVGRGVLEVTRDLGPRDRYGGSAPLLGRAVDEEVEGYLVLSEQVDSALGCAVILDGAGERVVAAGGVLVQSIGDGAERVAAARRRLRGGALAAALRAADPLALASAVVDGPIEVVSSGPVAFRCRCSRARVASALAFVPRDEIAAMLREDGGAEVTCEHCGERYHIGRPELERLL